MCNYDKTRHEYSIICRPYLGVCCERIVESLISLQELETRNKLGEGGRKIYTNRRIAPI
jgi:hypothetical protein